MSDYGAAYGDQSYTVNRSDQAKKDEKKVKEITETLANIILKENKIEKN